MVKDYNITNFFTVRITILCICLGFPFSQVYTQVKNRKFPTLVVAEPLQIPVASTKKKSSGKPISERIKELDLLPESLLMDIADVDFFNADSLGHILDEGELYEDELQFLGARILYDGKVKSTQMTDLSVRIISPKGIVIRGHKSPENFSFSFKVAVKSGNNQHFQFPGYGTTQKVYSTGKYDYEIWSQKGLLYKKNFFVKSGARPVEKCKYFSVSSISFMAVDRNEKVLNQNGAPIYADQVRFIYPKMKYHGLSSSEKSIKLQARIIRPDGVLFKDRESPACFSYEKTETIKPGENSIVLLGWGEKTSSIFPKGVYLYELWYGQKKIFETTFAIK